MNTLLTKEGGITREDCKNFFQSMLEEDNNIYAFLTQEDMTAMMLKLPKEAFKNEEVDKATTVRALEYIKDKKDDCDYRVVANYMKIIAIAMENRGLLHEAALKETIDALVDGLINYIYQ